MGSNPKSITGGTFAPTDETFKITVKPAGVRFLSRGVQPPSSIYVEAEDDLAVSVASSVANETVTFNYRLLRFDGEIIEGQFTVSPASNRSVKKYSESLAEGFLLSMSCQAAAATTRGQTFVRVALTSPAFGGNLPSYMLMADYVTNAMAPAHPNGRVLAPTEGPGNIRGIAIASPGAGINFSAQAPVNARWRVTGIRFVFTTTAVVATRIVSLQVTQGGQIVYLSTAIASQAASLVETYGGSTFTPNAQPGPATNAIALPAGGYLLGGDLIQSSTQGFDVGDAYSGIGLAVEEWLDNV